MAIRLITRSEDSRVELMAGGVDVLDEVCKQACAKSSKDGAKLFAEREAVKLEGHEVCHGKLDGFLGLIASDESEGGVPVFACGDANRNGGDNGDLPKFDVVRSSVLPGVLDEICRSYVVLVLSVAILRAERAGGDGEEDTVKEEEKTFGGETFIRKI